MRCRGKGVTSTLTLEDLEAWWKQRVCVEDALHTIVAPPMEMRSKQSLSHHTAASTKEKQGMWTAGGLKGRGVMGGQEGQEEESSSEQREAVQHVEPPDEIKKKSFSQSGRAAEQSSDLICFQEPFCFLLSCCASNREPAGGSVNPCCAKLTCNPHQQPIRWLPAGLTGDGANLTLVIILNSPTFFFHCQREGWQHSSLVDGSEQSEPSGSSHTHDNNSNNSNSSKNNSNNHSNRNNSNNNVTESQQLQ